jgi:hypothetical protein
MTPAASALVAETTARLGLALWSFPQEGLSSHPRSTRVKGRCHREASQ